MTTEPNKIQHMCHLYAFVARYVKIKRGRVANSRINASSWRHVLTRPHPIRLVLREKSRLVFGVD